jgi:TRAP-type C4-dicarboxylate transport system permease small subunit
LEEIKNSNGIGHDVTDFSPREHLPPPPAPKGFIERMEKGVAVFSKWATFVAGFALTAMLVVSLIDVVGNKVFNRPLQGTSDYMSFLALITIVFAMSYAIIDKAHVQVDLFINKLPRRLKAFFEMLVAALGTGLFVFIIWSAIRYGIQLNRSHELSMTERIPVAPFVFAMAFACIPAVLYLFLELIRSAKKLSGK